MKIKMNKKTPNQTTEKLKNISLKYLDSDVQACGEREP